MSPRLVVPSGALGLALALVGSCSRDVTAEAPPTTCVQVPVAYGSVPDAGCVTALKVADPNGCRGEGTCAGPLQRILLCVTTDAAVICSCSEGADSESADGGTPKLSQAPCSTPADVASLAADLCGWRVP